MSFEDLQKLVQRRPFLPFRVYLTDGSAFEVRHPELFMLGKRSAVIGMAGDPGQTHYDLATMVDLLHIMRTEPIEAPAAAGSN